MVINTSLRRMDINVIELSIFIKMWRSEFTYVHRPIRFSKGQYYWEYKESRQPMPNAKNSTTDLAVNLHLDLIVEGRKYYSGTTKATVESLNGSMTIIVDGTDKNTTYVPKFKKSMKMNKFQ